mgnify:FL=1
MASVLDSDGRRFVEQRVDVPAAKGQEYLGRGTLIPNVVCQVETDVCI